MKQNPITGQPLWAKILDSAAFLRWQGKWYFWTPERSSENYEKNNSYQILRMNFFDETPVPWAVKLSAVFDSEDLRNELGPGRQHPLVHWFPVSPGPFRESFQQIKFQLNPSGLRKAVPISNQEGELDQSQVDKLQLIRNLLDTPETLTPYGFWENDEGFVGATPEILFELNNGNFQSMALAGTAAKTERTARELLNDEKELLEHRFVVQQILQSLQGRGDFQAEALRVLELPTLLHLMTPIRGFSKSTAFDLVVSLHPTPALGVYPRSFGSRWLKNLPLQEGRGSFGAPLVFEISPGHHIALVCLRRLDWAGKKVRIYAGCGVVEQSHFDREWSEIQNKIESVKKVLRLESL